MASNTPFKTSDLIHKYGWDVMPYLAHLPPYSLSEAQVLFVDSGHAEASDVDDARHGHTFDLPLATIDYAIGLCTAGSGDVIVVSPGHNEGLGNATIDFDVTNVLCIGLGHGNLTPRIDFDHANSSIDVGANGTTIYNLRFLPSVTDVLIGVDVESAITHFTMKDCEFMIGEDGAGTDEFVKAVHLTSGNHDCYFEDVKILAHASAAGATHGIHVDAASDRLTFKNVVIDGPYATGGIVEDAAGLNHVVEDCSVDTTGTNYGFHASSTFAKRTRNLDAGASEDTAENLIGRNDANNAADTSSVASNDDGSVLERLESVHNRVPLIVTKATGDLTAFGTQKNLFTTTGTNPCAALVRVTAVVQTSVTSTSGTTTLSVGYNAGQTAFIATDTVDNTAFAAQDVWTSAVAANSDAGANSDAWKIVSGTAGDIRLYGSVNDITAGNITFICEYIPLTGGISIAAAA